jgi:cytidylate kinase
MPVSSLRCAPPSAPRRHRDEMNAAPIVTVDGPAGSGKSTLGRALAIALRLPLIDTGLFYRGVMVAAVRAGVGAADVEALGALAQRTVVEVATDPAAGDQGVIVDGVPAGELLHDPTRAALLASVARTPAVRQAVLAPQRALAEHGAIAVGRDCGTVVFPDAPVKFYLEAPEAVREQRRLAQFRKRGANADDRTLRAEVGDRDRADTDRAVSPLRRAADAHVIDTSTMGKAEMIEHALAVCRAAGLRPAGAP